MLIKTEERTLEATGIQQQAAFKIKPDAMMFKKLSKDIYTNPLQAVVRELLDNAIDATNKDLSKVTVRLPNEFEPTLSIEDRGKGMSHEFIIERFPTYGESTKSTDNNAIGGFGMGGKSPFALTESFSIQAFDSEGLRTYTCFKDAQGLPNIALVFKGAKPKGSPDTGITVKVPIKKDKIKELTDYVKVLLECKTVYFNQSFNVIGLSDQDKKAIEDRLASVFVYNDAQTGLKVTIFPKEGVQYILMGGTPYPFSSPMPSYRTDPYWVHYPVGAFEVTLSRETIDKDSFSKRVDELRSLVMRARAALIAHRKDFIQNKVVSLTNYEKLVFFSKFKDLSFYADHETLNNNFSKYLSVEQYMYLTQASEKFFQDHVRVSRDTYYNGTPDQVCFVYNDTSLRRDEVEKKIKDYRKKLRVPSLQKFITICYTSKPVDTSIIDWPSTAIFNASDIFTEIAGDKQKALKLIAKYKNEALIRFKLVKNNGISALTAEEYKTFKESVDKVYYFSLEKNIAPDISVCPLKDCLKDVSALNEVLGTQGILFVPKGKEKFLDPANSIDIAKEYKDSTSEIHKKLVQRIFESNRDRTYKNINFYNDSVSRICKKMFPIFSVKASQLNRHAYATFQSLAFLSNFAEQDLYKKLVAQDVLGKENYLKERAYLQLKYPLFFYNNGAFNDSLDSHDDKELLFYKGAKDASFSKSVVSTKVA